MHFPALTEDGVLSSPARLAKSCFWKQQYDYDVDDGDFTGYRHQCFPNGCFPAGTPVFMTLLLFFCVPDGHE